MLTSGKGNAKLKFSVPRASLMKAIRREIFDDLLIGNFMKTQLFNCMDLYSPDFTMAVTKYSDNGGVKAEEELRKYFNYYNKDRILEDKYNSKILNFRSKIKRYISNDLLTKIKFILR